MVQAWHLYNSPFHFGLTFQCRQTLVSFLFTSSQYALWTIPIAYLGNRYSVRFRKFLIMNIHSHILYGKLDYATIFLWFLMVFGRGLLTFLVRKSERVEVELVGFRNTQINKGGIFEMYDNEKSLI